MHFNLVDLLLLAALGVAVYDGRRRGFAPYATELGAFSAGLALAFLLFQPLGGLISRWLGVTGALAGFGSFLLLLIVGHALGQLPLEPVMRRLGRLPRAAGAVPAAGTAVLVSAVVLSGLVVLPSADSRSLVSGSALGSTLARGTSFLQPDMRELLVPASQETRRILDPNSSPDTGEDAFYQLHFPADLQIELDVDAENRMLDDINRVRGQAGLSRLEMDPLLQAVARAHSADMYERHYFSHLTPDKKTPYDRMRDMKVRYVTAGENIAFAPAVDSAWDSLMHSPDHRANILNPDFRCVGIGAYRGLDGYEEMFTQDFADCES